MTEVKAKISPSALIKVEQICEKHGNRPGELINILEEIQGTVGFLPEDVQRLIAHKLGLPASKINGVVSFYTFFTTTPRGKHRVSVCLGTACYVRGAEKNIDEIKRVLGIEVGDTTPDGKFSLDCLRCLGACGLAPVMMVDEQVYGRLQMTEIRKILDSYE
ncbi:MAG: NAD(P)H-dependent oxidoreductase subunit E [Bacteroidales bacterium]|nr:NAD(P)H-dependent oxidoreductase subunit E [Bacteroidales bacterium]MDD4421234.1 NAD(P)H-dependent oxidoreductase subunit E [Bacteroidales bacterium]